MKKPKYLIVLTSFIFSTISFGNSIFSNEDNFENINNSMAIGIISSYVDYLENITALNPAIYPDYSNDTERGVINGLSFNARSVFAGIYTDFYALVYWIIYYDLIYYGSLGGGLDLAHGSKYRPGDMRHHLLLTLASSE